MSFTWGELARCAEREAVLRKSVYPGLIERKRMKKDQAELEIEKMLEIARQLSRMQGIVTAVRPLARVAIMMRRAYEPLRANGLSAEAAGAASVYLAAYHVSPHEWETLAKMFGEGEEGDGNAEDTAPNHRA